MPDTRGQTFTPATAGGLNRRQIKRKIETSSPILVNTHTDGTIHATWKLSQFSQAAGLQFCKDACSDLGFTLRVKSLTPADSNKQVLHFFTQETAEQGLCGRHFYRGAGEVIIDTADFIPEEQDLQGMTKAALLQVCQQRGLEVPPRATKAVLLALLTPAPSEAAEGQEEAPESHPDAAALAAEVEARLQAAD